MRGRDGNSSLLLRFCSALISVSFICAADEYLVSYRYVVKEMVLFNETLLISKAMTKCKGKPQEELVLESQDRNFKKIVSQNSPEFIDFIHRVGLHAEHKEATLNLQNSSTTIMTLKTTCFKVDFNDNFVTITPLK